MKLVRQFEDSDAIFDIAWNEVAQNIIFAGCGDGSIKIYDTV